MKLYKSEKFAKAEPQLVSLLDEKNLKGDKKHNVIHALGEIAYHNKKYEDAIVYMSRLYTEAPKSALVPSALLTLAKSFGATKQADKASVTLEQITTDYPKSSEAKKALELLKKASTESKEN